MRFSVPPASLKIFMQNSPIWLLLSCHVLFSIHHDVAIVVPNSVALFPVSIYSPAHQRLHRLLTVPGRRSRNRLSTASLRIWVDPVHNIPATYSDSANVHIASTINFNARGVYPDNYSPGRKLQTING